MAKVAERVSAHRGRMRAAGFRELRIWVPDIRSKDFSQTARLACQAMNDADRDSSLTEFLAETSWADQHWDEQW